MREGPHPLLGCRDADLGQQVPCPAAHLAAWHGVMGAKCLGDLPADRVAGVERRGGFLEHHRDVPPGQPPAGPRGELAQLGVLERDALGADPAGRRQQPHHRQHRYALARAGFADDAQHLARRHRQVDGLDRVKPAACRFERDREVPHVQQGIAHLRSFGSSASRSPSPSRLKAITVTRIQSPGKVSSHQGAAVELQRVGQHGAPFRGGRLRAKPEEAQRRRVQDRGGEAQCRLHDQRRQAVRQHNQQHQPHPRRPPAERVATTYSRDSSPSAAARDNRT